MSRLMRFKHICGFVGFALFFIEGLPEIWLAVQYGETQLSLMFLLLWFFGGFFLFLSLAGEWLYHKWVTLNYISCMLTSGFLLAVKVGWIL